MIGFNENVLPAITDTPALTSTADTPSVVASQAADGLEVIGGFRVHPAASKFPLMEGKEFDDLVDSVLHSGTVAPVETHDGLLIDGRNRVRAVAVLRSRGIDIALPTIAWAPAAGETVEEHIYAVNVHRRHLTDDQRAALAVEFLPAIRKSREERQAATRFGSKALSSVAQNSSLPSGHPAGMPRSSREKDAASTIGQLAAFANISRHKAIQAVTVADGVESGEIAAAELQGVAAGSKRLLDVVRAHKPARTKKSVPLPSAPPAATPLFDTELDAPAPTEDEVRRRWDKFKRPFAIADHRELRRLLKKRISEEQQQFDQ
jgi:hypothetical protein